MRFRMRKLLLINLLGLIGVLWSATAFAQVRTVEGSVVDATDKTALPGVNVVISGTNKGTATDGDGKFRIELQPNENSLAFSFIGYQTQTVDVTNAQTVIYVDLAPDTQQLQEVIVVGYGEQKKSDITGATANIKGEELARQPVLTATQAMQGKVAGVQIISSGQPGSSPQIRIRGVSTALSGTTALYVVDGVLTDDITNINTADIVDMNILKDASAAAIYGSRGANGVVIITTKKGQAGGIKVSYNNNIGFRQAANMVKMANAREYSNYIQAATGAAPAQTPYDTDWYGTITRPGFAQQHNLSISGGTEKATHLLNIGYLNEKGILKNNSFRRLTLRLNEEYKLTSWLKVGLLSSYGNSDNQNGFGNVDVDPNGAIGGAYNDAYRAAPTVANYVDGRYGNTSGYQNVGNPLLDLMDNDIRVNENRLQGSTYIEVKPVSWITLRSSIGGDFRNSLNRGYFYQFNADQNTFLISGGNQYSNVSNLTVKSIQSFRWVWDNTVTLNKKFGLHEFTLLAGTTAEQYHYQALTGSRNGVGPDPNLWYLTTGNANSSQNDGTGDKWARNSYLTRLNYNYDGRYLLTATLRRDGSSRLPGANRWQIYPSVGVGWMLTREGFMQNQNIFDMLKIRGSYGKVGNDQIPTDAYTSKVDLNHGYGFNGSGNTADGFGQIRQVIDPSITWETTVEYDGAVEFGLLQNRLTGEVNFYDKRVNNALIDINSRRTAGDFDHSIFRNVMEIQNRGLEILLTWKGKAGNEFSYTISGNATFNQNKVLALNGGQAILGGSIGASQNFTTLSDNGQPVGSFYVLKTIGVFNTGADVANYVGKEGPIQPTAHAGDFKYQDTNGDGHIDDNDRVFAGSYQPKVYMGLNFSANYKAFDFALAIYGNLGNQVYNGKRAVRINGLDNVEKSVVYDRWTSQNQNQKNPGANTGNQLASDYYVSSGSFARINNITVGYTFPDSFLNRTRLTSFRVFATSQNTFTLKKYSGFTAELPGSPTNSGIELSTYPTTRTIAVGVNVGF
ncbi:MAG: TonB-dependent receptor [Bacteroidota bacterium]